MAKHKIQIEGIADFSSISKEVKDLSSTVSNAFGKDGVKILDDKSVIFLKKETQTVFNKMTQQLSSLKNEAGQLGDELKTATEEGGKREKIEARLLSNLKAQVKVEKDLATLRRTQNTIETGVSPERAAKAAAEQEKKAAQEQKASLKAKAAEERKLSAEQKAQQKEEKAAAKAKAMEERKALAAHQKTLPKEEQAALKAQALEAKKLAKETKEQERIAQAAKREADKKEQAETAEAARKQAAADKEAQKKEKEEAKKADLEAKKLQKEAFKKMTAEERSEAKAKIALEKKREKERVQEFKKLNLESKKAAKDKADQDKKETKVLDLSQKLAEKKKRDEEKKKAQFFAEQEKKAQLGKKAVKNTVLHGAGDIASQLPGGSEAMHVGNAAATASKMASAGEMGILAGTALIGVAVAAAAAAVAISRMVSGFEVFKQAMPNLMALTGMETAPITDSKTVSQAGELGYGQLEMLDIQKTMEQALGKAKTPEQDQNRLLNVLTAARDTGMDPRQIISGADQLRQVGGTEVGSRQIAAIMDKAITSGMDKSQVSSFLSATVGLLTEINSNGVNNNTHLLSVMADLVAGGHMSSEQAAKTIAGMNEAVAGSSGENNSFFQGAAANAGLGGGSILGTQFAVRQGLAGVNYGDIDRQAGDTAHGQMGLKAMKEMGLGDKDFTTKFAGSILGEIDQRFDTKTKAGRQGALGFTGQMFGTKTAGESVKVLAVLEKMAAGTELSRDDKKLLEDLGKDPDAAWREQTLAKLDVTSRATLAMQAALEKGQFELGKSSAEYFNALTGALVALDATINDFLTSDTFESIKDGLAEVADVIGNVFGDAFTDLMKVPDALSELFDSFMASPNEFGKLMGKGFADIVMSTWDEMLKGLKSIMEYVRDPTKLAADWDDLALTINSTLKDVAKVAGEFGNGVFQGAAEGQEEYNQKGSVSYDQDQTKTLGNMGDIAKGIIGASIPGLAVRAAAEFMTPAKSDGTLSTQPQAPTNYVEAPKEKTDNSDQMLSETKKTNQLLERITRPWAAPRAGRESSRAK